MFRCSKGVSEPARCYRNIGKKLGVSKLWQLLFGVLYNQAGVKCSYLRRSYKNVISFFKVLFNKSHNQAGVIRICGKILLVQSEMQ